MKRGVSIALLIFTFCLSFFELQAQDATLTVMGEGSSKEMAVQNALVSAVEQAYGVYVSGNTKILNDELIRDEVVQIKRGNIKRYTILNESKLPDRNYSVTLDVTVSTDNLLKFAQSKGAECELAGKTFAANLKLFKLHLSSGAKAMKHLYDVLGQIAPNIYDYKLNLGEPIIYKSEVYIPIAVDCVPNDNFGTFMDIYNTTYGSIQASIRSIPIQGDTKDNNLSLIKEYERYIQELPKIWAFGFELSDNNDNYVAPLLNAKKVCMPENAFWPSKGVRKFNIYRNNIGIQLFQEDKNGSLEWIVHRYVIYDDQIILFTKGMKIQKLDYEPLCSLSRGQTGGKVLEDYVRKVEQEFSVATTGVSYANEVYDIRDFDNRMVIWTNGKRKVNRYTWVDDPAKILGKTFCTINFFICYKDADIEKVSDIKVRPILQED